MIFLSKFDSFFSKVLGKKSYEYKKCWHPVRSFAINGLTNSTLPKEMKPILLEKMLANKFTSNRWYDTEALKLTGYTYKPYSRATECLMNNKVVKLYNENQLACKAHKPKKKSADMFVNPEPKNAEIEEWLKKKNFSILVGTIDPAYWDAHDLITIPDYNRFDSANAYYTTLFHEIGHWTGKSGRLGRASSSDADSFEFAKEEIVSELICLMLMEIFGLDADINSSIGYCQIYKNNLFVSNKKSIVESIKESCIYEAYQAIIYLFGEK